MGSEQRTEKSWISVVFPKGYLPESTTSDPSSEEEEHQCREGGGLDGAVERGHSSILIY